MRRWVRYEAPVMVCVELDPDDHTASTVINVVVGDEEQDITLARDHHGTVLVYDEQMQRPQTPTQIDQRAITIAEHRQWPEQPDWEHGPNALHYPRPLRHRRATHRGPTRRRARRGRRRRRHTPSTYSSVTLPPGTATQAPGPVRA